MNHWQLRLERFAFYCVGRSLFLDSQRLLFSVSQRRPELVSLNGQVLAPTPEAFPSCLSLVQWDLSLSHLTKKEKEELMTPQSVCLNLTLLDFGLFPEVGGGREGNDVASICSVCLSVSLLPFLTFGFFLRLGEA